MTDGRLPPLSEVPRRLAALSAAERRNLKLVELICYQDAAAVGRLLSLAPADVAITPGSGGALTQVLTRLGPDEAIELLASTWNGTNAPPEDIAPLCDLLQRHIFSVCATTRRLIQYSGLAGTPGVSFSRVQLLAIVDKLCLGFLLSPGMDGPMRDELVRALKEGRHDLHARPALATLFRKSDDLASYWGLAPENRAQLKALASADVQAPDAWAAHLVLAAELVLDADAHKARHAELARAGGSGNPVLERLLERGVDPRSMARLL